MCLQSRNKTHRYRALTWGYQKGMKDEKDNCGGMNQYKLLYKIDTQQGYTIEHKELYPLSCNNL